MLAQRYLDPVIGSLLSSPGLTVANFPAQTIPIPIDTGDPIEEIRVVVTATVKANITTFLADHLLNVVRRFRLNVTHPVLGQITPVDITGPGAIEMMYVEDENGVDPATLNTILYGQSGNIPNGAQVRIVYRIAFPQPRFTDTMRLASLLPTHLFDSTPILYIDFGAATEICTGTADPFSAISAEVVLVRREWKGDFASYVAGKGFSDPIQYFLPVTIGEAANVVNVSLTNQEVRLPIVSPGRLCSLIIRSYKGNATVSRATIDDNTTIGTETMWELQRSRTPFRKWRNKYLQIDNQIGRTQQLPWAQNWYAGMITAPGTGGNTADGVTTGGPPLWVTAKQLFTPTGLGAGALAAGQCIQDPALVYVDFSGSPGREIYESGGFLDVTPPDDKKNQLIELVGKVTTPANNASSLKLVTRLYTAGMDRFATVQ
jgi:hypothetical protein